MYVRLLAEGAFARGRAPILLLGPGAVGSEEFSTHLGELESRVRIITFDGLSVRGLLLALENETWSLPVVFADGDPWLPRFITSPPIRGGVTALVMRADGQASRGVVRAAQTEAKSLLRQSVRLLRRYEIFTLTGATNRHPSRRQIPDPGTMIASASDGAEVRASWDRATPRAPRYWVGVVGAIGPRKNVDIVADAIASTGGEIGLIIAGQNEVDETTIDAWLQPLTRQGNPIVRVSGTLDEYEFDAIIQGLDCVLVAHSNEGPSGILAKAVLAGTKVVAAGAQSLKRDAENSEGMVIWSALDAKAIARNLVEFLPIPSPSSPSAEAGKEIFCDRLLSNKKRK